MSYFKSLRNTLKDKNETLFHKLEPIEIAAKSVLTYAISVFPYYTPHDFSHSANVEEILNWLIPDEIKPKMNEYELYFLIIAAWLHDWGMVAAPGETPEEVRKQHHIRTETNFEDLHNLLGISLSEARIIGRICRGHRDEDIFDQRYEDQFFGSGNKLIKVRFLTALLRVADETDVTQNRTPEIVYYTLRPQGASKEEYEKHLSIGGIGPIAPHKLRLSGVAKTPRGVEVIEGVRAKIQAQIDSVKTVLILNGVALDSIEAKIDTKGFINKPIAFELDRKTIVNLLIGSFLYSRKDTAIRELVQNAIDTCRLKKKISPEFVPIIEIGFNGNSLSFEDNGIGMNFEEASEYFARKGSSFYVSDDLKELLNGKDFDPINKFGIGVLSSFMIADKMIVETKKENCAPCRFIIDDISDGWTYETGGRTEPGTKVTLLLNDNGKKVDVVQGLTHYLKNVPISIFANDLDKQQRYELCQKWSFDIPEVKELVEEEISEKFYGLIPDIVLTSKNECFSLSCYYFKDALFSRRGKKCILLNHGLFVGDFDFFPGSTYNWVALINCTSNLVDLKVSREDIVNNDKYTSFLGKLYHTLFQTIRLYLEKKPLNMSNFDGFVAYSKLVSQFFEQREVSENQQEKLWVSEVLKSKIFAVGKKEGLVFLSGTDLLKENFSRIIHYRLPLEKLEKHIKMIGPQIWKNLEPSEAVIFDPPPHYYNEKEKGERNYICCLCSAFETASNVKCECTSLSQIVAEWKMEKHETHLDLLLPEGSYFSPLPSYLQGGVIQAKPFEFERAEKKPMRDAIAKLFYSISVGQVIFSDIPQIAKNYENLQNKIGEILSVKFSLKEKGYFIFDLADPFLMLMLCNAEKILANEVLKNTVVLYFRALAMHYVGTISMINASGMFVEVSILEKIIADFLGFRNYVSLIDRSGELIEILDQDE